MNSEQNNTNKKENWIVGLIIALFTLSALLPLLTDSEAKSGFDSEGSFLQNVGNKPGIGVINIHGPLYFAGESQRSLVPKTNGVGSYIKQLKAFEKDENVKAVIIRINSPGGTVGASQELYQAINRFKTKTNIPVYASIGDVGASGGYWIALACDEIYANPGSMIGSIGVILSNVDFSQLANQYGVNMNTIKSGRYKDIMSSWRELENDERALLQNMVNDVFDQFKTVFKEERNLDDTAINKLADGRIFTGRQAILLNVIDRLGSLEDAIRAISDEVSLVGEPHIITIEKPSFYQLLDAMEISPTETYAMAINSNNNIAMTFNTSLLYNYIVHPIKTIEAQAVKKPLLEGLASLALISLGNAALFGFLPASFIYLWGIFLLGSLFFLFIQVTATDFFAQWFKGSSQSLTLFSWLGLTMLPYAITLHTEPLFRLLGNFGDLVYQLLSIAVGVLAIYLQFKTIKTLYKFNTGVAILVYLSPVIAIILGAILCSTLFFSYLSSMF